MACWLSVGSPLLSVLRGGIWNQRRLIIRASKSALPLGSTLNALKKQTIFWHFLELFLISGFPQISNISLFTGIGESDCICEKRLYKAFCGYSGKCVLMWCNLCLCQPGPTQSPRIHGWQCAFLQIRDMMKLKGTKITCVVLGKDHVSV